MPEIDLGPVVIQYSVVRGRSRSYSYMRFTHDLRLEVVVPRGFTGDPAAFIESRRSWVLGQYRRLSRQTRVLAPDYVLFDGTKMRLAYEDGNGSEYLRPDFAAGMVIVKTGDRGRTPELVRRWFLKETSAYVVRKVSETCRGLGVKYSKVDVREIRNWGYCTRTRRLSFSWQLIALPERLRDYVVFHEVSHLSHMNHSRAFRDRLSELCPDFRTRERELDAVVPIEPVGAKPSRL